MTKPTMKERLARAMCDGNWDAKNFNETPSGETPEEQREYWIGKAEAVLDALYEPSEGMLAAGCEIGPDTNMGPFDYDSALDVFKAMIDHIRSEDKT